jgi:hypothetical protein
MTREKIASIALTAASGLRLTPLLCSAIRTTLRESAAEVNLAPHPGCVHIVRHDFSSSLDCSAKQSLHSANEAHSLPVPAEREW